MGCVPCRLGAAAGGVYRFPWGCPVGVHTSSTREGVALRRGCTTKDSWPTLRCPPDMKQERRGGGALVVWRPGVVEARAADPRRAWVGQGRGCIGDGQVDRRALTERAWFKRRSGCLRWRRLETGVLWLHSLGVPAEALAAALARDGGEGRAGGGLACKKERRVLVSSRSGGRRGGADQEWRCD